MEFTAQTRMSGVDLPDGTKVRKGASDAIAQMLEETLDGFAVPLIQTAEVAQREHTAKSSKPFFFQMFPNGIAGEEER